MPNVGALFVVFSKTLQFKESAIIMYLTDSAYGLVCGNCICIRRSDA